MESTKIAIKSWCGAKKDPINLPYGKDLYGDDLRKALEIIFHEYYTDIVVVKLSHGVIGTKNLKIRYYGARGSIDFRVAQLRKHKLNLDGKKRNKLRKETIPKWNRA